MKQRIKPENANSLEREPTSKYTMSNSKNVPLQILRHELLFGNFNAQFPGQWELQFDVLSQLTTGREVRS